MSEGSIEYEYEYRDAEYEYEDYPQNRFPTKRRSDGETVKSADIRKHKNDVFRLATILDPDFDGFVPDLVRTDLGTFLNRMPQETVDLKALGIRGQTLESVCDELRRIYRIGV